VSEVKLRLSRLEWALMMQESSGRPHTSRLDARLRAALAARGVAGAELEFQSRTWGLWQLRGSELRRLGYQGQGAEFCRDVAIQLLWMRRKWDDSTDARDPDWWNIEHWNQNPLESTRRPGPTAYYRGVSGWLRLREVREEMLEIYFAVAA
jgi:hypothetical protein